MKILRLLLVALLLVVPLVLLAQYDDYDYSDDAGEMSDEAAAALCGGLSLVFLIIGIVYIAIGIWATIWVSKDSVRRGYEKAGLFKILMIVGLILGGWWVIIWIIYLIVRPKEMPTSKTTSTPPPPPRV